MVVSGGALRPATSTEIARLEQREVVSWELTRLPGRGPEGMARMANGTKEAAGGTPDGYLITCTCGHLFRHELPE